jgi:hypothetical protein
MGARFDMMFKDIDNKVRNANNILNGHDEL